MSAERRIIALHNRRQQAITNRVESEPATRLNIIEFARDVLGIDLYPGQATLLKVLTLADDLFTDFDRDLIDAWTRGYARVDDYSGSHYTGTRGTPPDLLERIRFCQELGRATFREVSLVLGRRASKSMLVAIMVLKLIWDLLQLDDPIEELGMPPGKRLSVLVFGTTREYAQRDQFSEIAARVEHAPRFAPFVDHNDNHRIRLFTRRQVRDGANTPGSGLIDVIALPTKPDAGRGPAAIMLILDEIGHADDNGTRGSDAYQAATPAMAQFDHEALTMMASSPSASTGAFFDAHRYACQIDPHTGRTIAPATFTLQLQSWGLYEGWERSAELDMWPGGPPFKAFKRVPIRPDSPDVVSLKARDHAAYLVEHEAQWASSSAAYLTDTTVEQIFAAFPGDEPLAMRYGTVPPPSILHLDPSHTGANFALVVAHLEVHRHERHVVIDFIHVWRPSDSPNGEIDYTTVIGEIVQYIGVFRPTDVTIDQYQGAALCAQINTLLVKQRSRPIVRMVPANPSEKPARYEKFKLHASQGLIHSPHHALARDELRYLRRSGDRFEPPTRGPVTTADIADSFTWVNDHLQGPNVWIPEAFEQLTSGRPPSADPGGAFGDLTGELHRRNQAPHNPARPRRDR